MRNKIRLDTVKDCNEFVQIVQALPGKITIVDESNGYRVNGKSILGAIASMEFDDLYVESENDIYMHIEKFIVID